MSRIMELAARRLPGVLFVAVLFSACGGNGGDGRDADADADGVDGETDGFIPVVTEWDEEDYPYRVLVTLRPDPDRDRSDVPVIAQLSHPGAFILRDVVIYEITGGMEPRPVEGGAWSQPDGNVFEAGFTAPGTTAAGQTRLFLVYYRTADVPPARSWEAADWGSFELLDADGDTTTDGFSIAGGGRALSREIDPDDGTLVEWRRPDGETFLELSEAGWRVAEGFRTEYQLESSTETHPPASAGNAPVSRIDSDGDSFSAAASAVLAGAPAPVSHDFYLTYRVFRGWPFVEVVMSAVPAENPGDYEFSSSDWNGRLVYLSDAYDRMISDTRGEEDLSTVWDTSMRWLVVFDAASDRGFGWLDPAPGVIRAGTDDDGVYVHDSYGYSAASTAVWRYVWMASPSKDEIVETLGAMKPGADVAPPESRDLNIAAPRDDDFFFPDDVLSVVVTTPGSRESVTATLLLPDGSSLPVELDNAESPLVWLSTSPLLFTAAHPEGRWTLTARSAGGERVVGFEFRVPDHPHLMFAAADLAQLRSRKDDAAYQEIWAAMLDQASDTESPMPETGVGRDIRGYADTLMNLALVQLVDPDQPYEEMMWSYFFTILRYPNWDDEDNPFNNEDLAVSHFLTALAVTYDWHYDGLTPAERAEVRGHLREFTARWVTTSHLRTYRDIDWTHYGTVTNNHYWINNEGVAAAAYVLADEMPESERAAWVAKLEENLAVIFSVLEDDGTSNEGVAYHSYGQINLFRWLDMRDRARGGNSAEESPWFRSSILYDLYSVLPGGGDNYGGVANFGDCPPHHYNSPRSIQAWLAGRLGDGVAQWSATQLDWPRLTAMYYLWYDPDVEVVEPPALPAWRLFGDRGIFAWRSSWDDDATYFSLKSGAYFGGHEQPDAGHFILHRAGIPYVTDHGYSYHKMADEHNLILAGGVGQQSEGQQWMSGVDPVHWARIVSVLAEEQYFDMVADPTPMMLSADLQSWTREVVGLGPSVFVVKDDVAAAAAVGFDWLLHSYMSDPPTSERSTYTYTERRTENPWTEISAWHWGIQPQDGAPILHVADVSSAAWAPVVEPSFYVPEIDPDTRSYNESLSSFQVGHRLRRSIETDGTSSTVVLWFGDDLLVESWSDAQAEAARIYTSGGDAALVVWPASGSLTGFHGLSVTGAMAGRRFDEEAFFGRDLAFFQDGTDTLVSASTPVSLLARLEHSFTAADPGVVVVGSASNADLDLFCPAEPGSVEMDGASLPFTWSAGILSVTVPAGTHRIEAL